MTRSTLQRRTQHTRLCDKAPDLNNIFSKLFPITCQDDYYGRIKLFSKIISEKKFKLNTDESQIYLTEVCKIKTRAGKKKILDLFEELELVTKLDNAIVPTRKGEKLWKLLTAISKENPELQPQNQETTNHFSRLDIRIHTDGKEHTNVFHEWCFCNRTDKPVQEFEFSAYGDVPLEDPFRLKHSENIKEYRIMKDTFNHKRFTLILKEPIQKGQTVSFWYSYDWPGMYLTSFSEWDYSLILRIAPVKEVCIRYLLGKDHPMDKKDFHIYQDEPKENSVSIGQSKVFDPLFLEDSNEVVWKIQNWPTFRTVKLSWKFM